MKKYIMTLLVAVVAAFGAMAQDMTPAFTLTTSQGDDIQFLFVSQPEITFDENGEDLLITDKSGTVVRYAMADVKNITFGMVDAVESVGADSTVAVSLQGDMLSVAGLGNGDPVDVYSASGQKLASATAGPDGRVAISTAALGKGVFVAVIPGHTFKFIR